MYISVIYRAFYILIAPELLAVYLFPWPLHSAIIRATQHLQCSYVLVNAESSILATTSSNSHCLRDRAPPFLT